MTTLILSGFGTNCERETAYACRQAGAAAVEVRHINALYEAGPAGVRLERHRFVVLIGGFLDGDDLGGARACANRFRYRRRPQGGTVLEALHAFVAGGGLLLGICNGFQLLVKLGLLPGLEGHAGGQQVTLTNNAHGRFEDRWVELVGDAASPCVFTRGVARLALPVRHGEGRIIAESPALLESLLAQHLVPLRYCTAEGAPTEAYPANPNGSPGAVAALCNARGTVMGLMPHPEAFNHVTNHPQWTRRGGTPPVSLEGDGLRLFRNAYEHLARAGAA
jgi:phosphoribosylformylglycinamidine synthase